MKRYIFYLGLTVLMMTLLCYVSAAEKFPVKVGDMEVSYAPQRGLQVSVFGTTVISSSYIAVVSPGWVTQYYNTGNMPDFPDNVTIEDIENGKRIIIPHISPEKDTFDGQGILTLLENNTLKTELKFDLLKKEPAILEWKVGGINPLPIIGNSFVASDDKTTTQGSIPMKAGSALVEESMVAHSFKTLKLDTRMGTIDIKTDPEAKAAFFDYRKNRWAEVNDPIFWFGLLERPVTSGKKYHYSVEFKFPEKAPSDKFVQKKEFAPEIKMVEDAMQPYWGDEVIIPEPKGLRWNKERFILDENVKIYFPSDLRNAITSSLDLITEEMGNLYHLSPETIPVKKSDKRLDYIIVLGDTKNSEEAFKVFPTGKVTPPDHNDGYAIYADKDAVVIGANNARGLFYGVSTLLQMINVRGDSIFVLGAMISDYPEFEFRGVHCLSGKGAGDEIAKAVRELMARMKMNSLVWECEYIIWDSHPELAHDEYGMKKSEARKVVEAANKYYMELIPLVQSLGHSEWIFYNDKNLDIAEDPETPYAYNPTNPKTYEFIFEVYQEAVDFFKPAIFHIGHDEVTMRGRFPYRSKDTGKSVTDLVLEDIRRLHDWFLERNIQVMLWGDMFLWEGEASSAAFADSREEARERRERLPRDVFISDWHYDVTDPAKYTSLKIFKEEGFKTCGASWFNPKNIRNLTLGCKLYDVSGLLQTTWAGFNFKINGNQGAWFQYWAYLWAAWYSWTGSDMAVNGLPFLASQTFLDIWSERKPVLENREGFLVNLDNVANRTLRDDARREGWVGMGHDYDLVLPYNPFFGETRFDIAMHEKRPGALLMAGNLNPEGAFPVNAELKLNDVQADELHFLMTAAFRSTDGSKSGEIVINYANGDKDKISLVYGENFFNFMDTRVGPDTRIVWWDSRRGEIQCMHDLIWKNPSPEKTISSISIESYVTDSAPALLAITGVQK